MTGVRGGQRLGDDRQDQIGGVLGRTHRHDRLLRTAEPAHGVVMRGQDPAGLAEQGQPVMGERRLPAAPFD